MSESDAERNIDALIEKLESRKASRPCQFFERASRAVFWLCGECGWAEDEHIPENE